MQDDSDAIVRTIRVIAAGTDVDPSRILKSRLSEWHCNIDSEPALSINSETERMLSVPEDSGVYDSKQGMGSSWAHKGLIIAKNVFTLEPGPRGTRR